MNEYTISIKEILKKDVKIKADNLDEAINIIEEKYYNEEIILDSDDHIDTEFITNTKNIDIYSSKNRKAIQAYLNDNFKLSNNSKLLIEAILINCPVQMANNCLLDSKLIVDTEDLDNLYYSNNQESEIPEGNFTL